MQIIKFSDFMDGSYKNNELSIKETDFFETFELLVGLVMFCAGLVTVPHLAHAFTAILQPVFGV
jgi:hypothetical protein